MTAYLGQVTLNGRTTTQMEVFRNPRRHQHASSRWILYRTSNGSSDGFRYRDDALAYGQRLNRHLVWIKSDRARRRCPMTPPCCPECGGSFTIDTTAEVERAIAPPFFVIGRDRLEQQRVRRPVAFCNDCEFSVELSTLVRRA